MPDSSSAPLLETLAPTLLPELRVYLERHRRELAAMLASPASAGMPLARRHAKVMDGLLTALFPAAYASMRASRRWSPVTLGAVGGYGRCTLALRSDLDVRLLTDSPERARPIAEALLYPLWDAGVAIGHQVTTIEQVLDEARTDLPTATALLDWRTIAGDAERGVSLLARAFAGVFADGELPGFMRRLEEEMAARHHRFGGSVYLLEPDVKNGPGGLRDLDVALWAAEARWRVSSLADLVRVGVLVPREANAIAQAGEFVWAVRNHLHAAAGRRSDRLTFDQQAPVARALGYGREPAPGEDPVEVEGPMVEAFMSDYYRHARTVSRARELVVSRATPPLLRRKPREEDLGAGLKVFEGHVSLSDPAQLAIDPPLALRLFATAVTRNLPVYPFARDAVARAAQDASFCAALRARPEAAQLFVELLCTVRETQLRRGSVLSELHDVGLLVAMIPEFSPVVGRVQHDVYHVYTVDVHSVAAVDRLRALVRGDLAHEHTLACHLAADATRPEVLFLATLLHDVGKAIGGKDHSTRGAEMSRAILGRFGLPHDDVEEICHLVAKHLLMYHVATRRDLDDPASIAEFAREVHGREGLRDLYLLTVADLSTTSPTAMTSWKARMLDDLYLATDALLSGASGARDDRLDRVREKVRERWGHPEVAGFLDDYLRSTPERYLLANPVEAIVAHAEVAWRGRDLPALAEIVPSRHPEAAELCLVAEDRPGLLAAITAAIAAARLEVHKAEIHSRTRDDGRSRALDLFWVRDRVEGAAGVPRVLPKLQRALEAIVSGEERAEDVATKASGSPWRERPSPPVVTEVALDDRASPRQTVIEVLTRDRPGLLFTLAHTLHELGLSIAVAKINTEGTRVADVFYVTEADGTKLDPVRRMPEVRQRILAALERLAQAQDGSRA